MLLGFRSRVLIAAATCCAVTVPIISALATQAISGRITRAVIDSGVWLQDCDIEACRQAPATWRKNSLGNSDSVIIAADARKVLRGSAEVPISEYLRGRLQAGADAAIDQSRDGGGGSAYRRIADEGPCSLFIVTWQPPTHLPGAILLILFVGAALALGLAVGLAVVVAIRPLVRRLQAVRKAADAVGDDERYVELADQRDDDIGAIAHALNGAHARMVEDAARLDARGRALEQHLADVAHDLRTPIASLQLALDRAIEFNKSERVGPLLGASLQDVMYIAGMVENLRLAAQLEHGVGPMGHGARADLSEIVERVSVRFALLGEQKQIEVIAGRPDEPVLCRCDPAMAEQAVANLVHNSVTYGHEGGHIAVLVERVGDQFVLTVVDDGPGVPSGELSLLAERTFRSDEARRRDPRGGGLGLAIARAVCERAGWAFAISAEQPHGLRVTFTGPCAELSADARIPRT